MDGNTFTERDIEDYLWGHPEALDNALRPFKVTQWVERQMRLPSGIADLVGLCGYNGADGLVTPIVVELKLNQVNSDALTQVSRYAADIDEILESMVDWPVKEYAATSKMVIGSRVSDIVFAEARALGILVHTYGHSFSFGGRFEWTDEYLARKEGMIKVAALSESFQIIKLKALNPIAAQHEFMSLQDGEN